MASVPHAAGCLAFRLADGFARNALFANQIILFQSLGGFGANGAQRAAKFLSATCSVAPFVLGAWQQRVGAPLPRMVLIGCFLEVLVTILIALAASQHLLLHGQSLVCCTMLTYALGYGAVTSAMPVLTRKAAPEGACRTGLMQAFVGCLSFGAMAGIGAAAWAESYRRDHWALLSGALALLLGACCLPPRGMPLAWARCVLRFTLGLKPEKLLLLDPEPTDARALPQLVLPLLLLVPFYAAGVQWTTSWYVLTLYLDRRVGGFLVPACLLQGFERLVSLAALGALLRTTSVLKLGPASRLAFGSLLAAAAMFAAALAEAARRDWWPRLPGEPDVSSLSVLWLLPQFALIATGEAFVYPACAEFLSTPVAYGFSCFLQAAAVALLGLLLGHLKDWIPESSPNNGHYDLFFISIGIACVISAGALLAVSKWKH
ncbi:unnamed protein product [Effrenium voratum]|uniref:Uncharacterized protein n=1 Tax=Effrenium voratum TaxID=2562239 RepID=A0AA36JMN5_9DINO|nr:unnamed protein product [Effrenium voratum]